MQHTRHAGGGFRSTPTVAWAALMVVVGREFGPAAAVLVVLYPLFAAPAAVSTPARRDRTRRTGSFA